MKLDSSISAVITGGASGLGEATARLFASKGVKVEKGVMMAPQKPSRQPSNVRDSRALLIDAAAELMTQRNSAEFSLSEVAMQSGLNAALVKYYFGNKRGLLVAVAERIATRELGQLDELLEMSLSAESKLRLHIAGIVKTYIRHPYYNRLIHSLQDDGDPEVTRLFVQPLMRAQKRLLEEGYSAGEFRKVDAVFFYISLIGACDSLFYAANTWQQAFGIEKVTDDISKRYSEYIADMVVASLLPLRETVRPMPAVARDGD